MSINIKTSINHSANPPIETKFGMHFQRLGTLPNLDQWQQVKSYMQSYSPVKLLTVSLQLELDILKQNPDYVLAVRVPTLGFTDPAFDYDTRPWFLTPVAINGYIAQAGLLEKTKVAELWATDIAENQFRLLFTAEGLFDYDKMNQKAQSEVIFTTLKNIHYIFSLATLLGEGLEALPYKEYQELNQVLCFFPPPVVHQSYQVDLLVLDNQKNIIQKRTVQISAEPQNYMFVSHFETSHIRAVQEKNKDYLNIKAGMYVEQELPFSRYGYKIKITAHARVRLGQLSSYVQPIPYHFRPNIDYVKGKKSAKKQENLYEYILFFGLSHEASKQLIQIIISRERFFKNHLIASVQESKKSQKQYNDYYLHPDLLDELYRLVTEACAHKIMPLYALSESFELSSAIFSKMMNLDTSHWDAHDQWVFERMIYEQLSSVFQGYDPMEVGFEWVDKIDKLLSEHQTDIDIQHNIDIISGKLSSQQVIELEIYLDDFEQSAFEKYQENTPSLILSKTLDSDEFNTKYSQKISVTNNMPGEPGQVFKLCK